MRNRLRNENMQNPGAYHTDYKLLFDGISKAGQAFGEIDEIKKLRAQAAQSEGFNNDAIKEYRNVVDNIMDNEEASAYIKKKYELADDNALYEHLSNSANNLQSQTGLDNQAFAEKLGSSYQELMDTDNMSIYKDMARHMNSGEATKGTQEKWKGMSARKGDMQYQKTLEGMQSIAEIKDTATRDGKADSPAVQAAILTARDNSMQSAQDKLTEMFVGEGGATLFEEESGLGKVMEMAKQDPNGTDEKYLKYVEQQYKLLSQQKKDMTQADLKASEILKNSRTESSDGSKADIAKAKTMISVVNTSISGLRSAIAGHDRIIANGSAAEKKASITAKKKLNDKISELQYEKTKWVEQVGVSKEEANASVGVGEKKQSLADKVKAGSTSEVPVTTEGASANNQDITESQLTSKKKYSIKKTPGLFTAIQEFGNFSPDQVAEIGKSKIYRRQVGKDGALDMFIADRTNPNNLIPIGTETVADGVPTFTPNIDGLTRAFGEHYNVSMNTPEAPKEEVSADEVVLEQNGKIVKVTIQPDGSGVTAKGTVVPKEKIEKFRKK